MISRRVQTIFPHRDTISRRGDKEVVVCSNCFHGAITQFRGVWTEFRGAVR